MRRQGHILIFEPDDLIRGLIERWLGEAGYAVVTGTLRRIPEAWAPQESPRLVIADVPSPRSAQKLIQYLREGYASPILILSARLRRGREVRMKLRAALACAWFFPSRFHVTSCWRRYKTRWMSPMTDVNGFFDLSHQANVDALRESEARFRALTELSSDLYWRQDEQFRFTFISKTDIGLSGHPLESAIGKARWDLTGIVTPLSSSWQEHKSTMAAHKPFRDFEYSRVAPDGSVRHLSSSGAPIFDDSGVFKGYHGIARDITEGKQLEERLRQAQRLEAMGTLAGGIAHDFNNILGAILGYGEMALRDAPEGSRLRRDIESILTAGERGRALVDRVLTFSRTGVGERIAVHVEDVVREALDLLAAKLPDGVKIDATLLAGRAAMEGEPTQIHQVLMNLAMNAIQAMPSGGIVKVMLRVQRVDAPRMATIGALTAGDYIALEVADTGTGIAAEILDRIFDPFFTTKEVSVGTGLGLSLVHGIVMETGGAIDVSSTVGVGSTFTIYLPQSGDAPLIEAGREQPLPCGAGERVLVVDDEEPLVKIATRTLEELGYAPVPFTSSAAALECVSGRSSPLRRRCDGRAHARHDRNRVDTADPRNTELHSHTSRQRLREWRGDGARLQRGRDRGHQETADGAAARGRPGSNAPPALARRTPGPSARGVM